MIVKFKGESDPLALIKGKEYEVLAISRCSGDYRVVDETEEDYLYPEELFEIIKKSPAPPFET